MDIATVPVKFLYNMFTPEELQVLGVVFMQFKDVIQDNSEEIDVEYCCFMMIGHWNVDREQDQELFDRDVREVEREWDFLGLG